MYSFGWFQKVRTKIFVLDMLIGHWIILATKYQPLVKMCIFFNTFSKDHL